MDGRTFGLVAEPLDAAQERRTFEVASVKRAAPDAVPRNQIVPTSPGRLYIPRMTLSWLIYTAYGDGGFNTAMRVTGGPDWVNRTSYVIEAVAPGTPTPRELRLILQPLLEERFALKLRIETQTIQTNTIVLDRRDGKLGPNLKEWDGTCRSCRSGTPSVEDEPTRPRCPSGYLPGRLFLDGATSYRAGPFGPASRGCTRAAPARTRARSRLMTIVTAIAIPGRRTLPLIDGLAIELGGVRHRRTDAADAPLARVLAYV